MKGWVVTAITVLALLLTLSSSRAQGLGEALNATNLTWTTTGGDLWFGQSAISHDGTSSAQSGLLTNGVQRSTLQTSVIGPGTLTFWWMMTKTFFSPNNLGFQLNGSSQSTLGFSTSWQQKTFYIGDGVQTFSWECLRVSGQVTGWVDQVSFVLGPTVPNITGSPANQTVPAGTNVTFNVSALGTPPFSFFWRSNGIDFLGTTISSLTITNVQAASAANYSVVVSNSYGTALSSNAVLTVNTSGPVITAQPANLAMAFRGNAAFQVSARGSDPLVYQWQFNSNNIPGATNSLLVVSGLQASNAGMYRVVITNAYGTMVSSNASLTVVPSVIVGWGNNTHGQISIPADLTNVIAISAGGLQSLALQSDHSVSSWGDNAFGQTNVPVGLNNVMAIASGEQFSLVLKNDRTVVAWGRNLEGQTNVPPSLTNMAAIAAGRDHSVALNTNGVLIAWGDGTLGQLNVPAEITDAVAIDAGPYHNLALRANGAVVAWGQNLTAQSVPTGLSDVVAVEAGYSHSLALKNDGTLVVWGDNGFGQQNVPSGLTNVVSISAGDDHTLALQGNGTVAAWGAGQITNSSYTHSGQSIVPPGLTNVVAVSGGQAFSLALVNDGSAFVARQPLNRMTYTGSDAFMSVGAVGTPPLAYQWQFSGTNISWATNALLNLATLSFDKAGIYRCIVTNVYATVTSSPAMLTVLRSTPRFDVSATSLHLTNSGFGLTLQGLSGHGNILIYASTNLTTWIPILTNPPIVGTLQFVDSLATDFPHRFFRAEEQ